MSSEWQRNTVVELTLAGRTVQYIADRFDCSISTIRWISKKYRETGRWQILPGCSRPRKTTACDERESLIKHIRFRSLAQVTPEIVTHLGHPVSKHTIQRRPHGQAIYSRVAVQKTGYWSREPAPTMTMVYQNPYLDSNKQLVCLLFSDESRFNLAYCNGRARV